MLECLRGMLGWAPRAIVPRVDYTPEYWTVSEAADRAGVTRVTVYKWIERGRLRVVAHYRCRRELAPLLDPAEVMALARDRKLEQKN